MEDAPEVPPHILPRFVDASKFTFEVGAAMIREIRQRSKNGQPNTWGHGCVHMSFLTNRKDLTHIFTHWDATLAQLENPHKPPPKRARPLSNSRVGTLKKQRKEDARAKHTMQRALHAAPPEPAKKIPRALQIYHAHCCEKLAEGKVGLVPRAFGTDETRALEHFVESDEGKLLRDFCIYLF